MDSELTIIRRFVYQRPNFNPARKVPISQNARFRKIIDITWISSLSLIIKKEVDDNASILYEM